MRAAPADCCIEEFPSRVGPTKKKQSYLVGAQKRNRLPRGGKCSPEMRRGISGKFVNPIFTDGIGGQNGPILCYMPPFPPQDGKNDIFRTRCFFNDTKRKHNQLLMSRPYSSEWMGILG